MQVSSWIFWKAAAGTIVTPSKMTSRDATPCTSRFPSTTMVAAAPPLPLMRTSFWMEISTPRGMVTDPSTT